MRTYTEVGSLGSIMPFVAGLRQGVGAVYRPDGSLLRSVAYENDLPHGPTDDYDEDGALLRRAIYADGMKNGPETEYGPNGKAVAVVHYRDDKKVDAGEAGAVDDTRRGGAGDPVSGGGTRSIWPKRRRR